MLQPKMLRRKDNLGFQELIFQNNQKGESKARMFVQAWDECGLSSQ